MDLWSPGFFCLLALALLGSSLQDSTPRVASLEIRGCTLFSTNEVLAEFNTKTGLPFAQSTLDEDLRRLMIRYESSGYLFTSIDTVTTGFSADSATVRLTVWISEGNQVLVDSVQWSGLAAVSEGDAMEALGIGPGSPFSPSATEQGIHRVLLLYEQRGYPLASIAIEDIGLAESGAQHHATIRIAVNESTPALIHEIRVEGNRLTREYVITRELRLGDGAVYTESLGRTLKDRLDRLQLFSSVSIPEFSMNPQGRGRLLIRVREGNTNRFDGILGYVPGRAGEAGFITGFAEVQFRNLFGTGRRLSTRWVRENPVTQDLSLRYFEPWAASLPVNVEVGFAQRKQDSTYIRRRYDFAVTAPVNAELTLGFLVDQTNTFPLERVNNPVFESSTLQIGASARYDTRDDPVTPREGALYATSYEWGQKRRTVQGRQTITGTGRVSFDVEFYVSPFAQQVLAFAFHGRDFQSPLIDQSDLYRLGGALTMRGYREGQFAGSRILWSSLEYRLLAGSRSFGFAFVDVGHISVAERPEAGLTGVQLTRAGYGIGIRIDSDLGLIGTSLAFGEGDTFRTAKLHLRLVNEF